MGYLKLNIEIVVFTEEASAAIADLTSAIDRLDEKYTIFGGDIEATAVEHSGARRKSVLSQTLDVGSTAKSAAKSVAQKAVDVYRKVI